MNKSSLLHRAASGDPTLKTKGTPANGTVQSRQAEHDAIDEQIAVYEATVRKVVTMPIESRANVTFSYANLRLTAKENKS